jgi:formylglycine-generating enzyme required for sulfatase activity
MNAEPETVHIPAGPFLMGSSEAEAQRILAVAGPGRREYLSWQQPQHRVWLSAYCIGRYPVTNAEYALFLQETDSPAPRNWSGPVPPAGEERHPVGWIRWEDACRYCRWLAAASGRPYRLPTEAEWEKAARGTDGRFYPWGDAWDPRRLNSREAGPGRLAPVGSYSPQGDSPYGAAEMGGGLWEWVADWFDPLAYRDRQDVRDPKGPATGRLHILRGGAFNLDGLLLANVSVRDTHDGSNVAEDDGFRVACSAAQELGMGTPEPAM